MEKGQLKSVGEVFVQSAQAVRRNLTLFIFLNILTILGTAWGIGLDIRDKNKFSWHQIFTNSLTGSGQAGDYPNIHGFIVLLLIIAGIALYLLQAILAYRAATEKTVEFSKVWRIFKAKWWQLLSIFILLIGIFIGGLILLIVPGIYLIARLCLAPIALVDQDIAVTDAIRLSWQLTKGHFWTMFVTVFLAVILSLPSIIPIIGRIIATSLTIAYSVALPIRYYELMKLQNHNG